ncbi:MAG TPA: S41 family peptidase, partial [Thermoanaerobaculia bacterium]|nr:S41 family peptidase [Thermoanaerobaculia bacterium]
MRRSWKALAIGGLTLSILLGGAFGDRLLALTDEARDGLRLYTELLTVAHQNYGEEVEFRDLVYASIQGMLRTLDPHTSFLPPEAYDSMRDRQQTSFYGLGILVGIRNGALTVISPLEGTPAARLGIRAGDVISTIEGEPTETLSLDEAVQKLKGPKGTQVNITIVRRGLEEPLPFTVTRAEIPQTTVRYAYMLDAETGYMLVSDFARGTGGEVERAIEQLKDRGMKRLLVDLRNNGGGLLDQAIDVADQFVPKGSKIVETRGRARDSFQEYLAAGEHPDLAIPVVVVVNAGTASAAEILAGAIQDHDMGLIVGSPTWGKGLVQTVYGLSYGAGLALTTAKYYTPSGRLIQRDYTSFFDYYYNHPDAPPIDPDPASQYLTDLGRKVYGGGGITPDVIAKPAETPPYFQFLLARNAFFDFVVDWNSGPHPPITSRDWQPAPEILAEFRAWGLGEKLGTAEELAKG